MQPVCLEAATEKIQPMVCLHRVLLYGMWQQRIHHNRMRLTLPLRFCCYHLGSKTLQTPMYGSFLYVACSLMSGDYSPSADQMDFDCVVPIITTPSNIDLWIECTHCEWGRYGGTDHYLCGFLGPTLCKWCLSVPRPPHWPRKTNAQHFITTMKLLPEQLVSIAEIIDRISDFLLNDHSVWLQSLSSQPWCFPSLGVSKL